MIRISSGSKIIAQAIALSGFLQLFSMVPFGQDSKDARKSTVGELQRQARQEEEGRMLRWKSILGSLSTEINSISRDNFKPYAMVQLADAFWQIDREVSKKLFKEAFESASSLDSKYRDKSEIMRYIMFTAGRRDTSLSKFLTEKLIDDLTDKKQAGQREINYRYRLNSRPTGFGEKEMDITAKIIFDLAGRDVAAADGLFVTYLDNYISNPALPLNQLLTLAGYAFGQPESVGLMFQDLVETAAHIPPSSLEPNPLLARMYLDVAYGRISAIIDQGASNNDAVNGMALFSTCYLIPNVLQFTPEAFPAWQRLHRAALANTSTERLEMVQKQLRFVNRIRKIERSGVKPLSEDPGEYSRGPRDTLTGIENMPEGCEKDLAYVRYALASDLNQDYSTIIRITDKIWDAKTKASIQEMIRFRKAVMLDGSELSEEVKNPASLVTAPELNVLLYARMASRAVGKDDHAVAIEALWRARGFLDSIESKPARASALLVIVRAVRNAGQDELKDVARELLRQLMTRVNEMDGGNFDTLSISYGVKSNCKLEDSPLIKSQLNYQEQVSLLGVIPDLKFIDADELAAICTNIKDETTRIRLIAQIAGNALANLRTPTSAKRMTK